MLKRAIAVGMAVVVLLGAGITLHFLRWADRPLAFTQPTDIFFAPGGGLQDLSRVLRDSGVLTNQRYFELLARLSGDAARLRAGEYRLHPGSNPRDVLAQIRDGDVLLHKVVLIAGMTLRQTVAALNQSDVLEPLAVPTGAPLDLLGERLTFAQDKPFLEGYFLPETYFVQRGDSVLGVLQRAHRLMEQAIAEAWQQRAVGIAIDSPAQLLILASLIEKETGTASERGQISQVFHLRLDKGMRLQTDPTIIYALGDGFDGNIRRRDLRVASPFNTYLYAGLPPTPIALPSVESLAAAAQPAAGQYLYFVARGDGTSQFSLTLEEHNRAVRKYQLAPGK